MSSITCNSARTEHRLQMMLYDDNFDGCISLASFQRMLVTKPWNSSLSAAVCEHAIKLIRAGWLVLLPI